VSEKSVNRKGAWLLERELGKGGQGTAYLAIRADPVILRELAKASRDLAFPGGGDSTLAAALALAKLGRAVGEEAAVKVLHEVSDDEEGKKARARMNKEIETMREVDHPHLLRCIEYENPDFRWYATEYHPGGTLDKRKDRYTGKALKALRDLRGVVEGVALLHEHGRVHRDIKPGNVFVASDGRLVLGDFGLVFFKDPGHTRVSGTMENVGSRDWMPGWALSMRVEDVRPTFDVFGLGKVLYSMVSKIPGLRLWYHQAPEFSLETMFPDDPAIEWVSHILKKAVVEHEKEVAYKDASQLLLDFERAIAELSGRPRWTRDQVSRSCQACGLGKYQSITVLLPELRVADPKHDYTAIACDRCGHVQTYRAEKAVPTPALTDASPDASRDGPISAEILGIDWTSAGPATLRVQVAVENSSDRPDTIRKATLALDGSTPVDMVSEGGVLPRLEGFDRKVVMLRAGSRYSCPTFPEIIALSGGGCFPLSPGPGRP